MTLEDLLHQVVVEGGEDVEQLLVVLRGLRLVLVGDLDDLNALTVLVVVDRGGHRGDVDDAEIPALRPDGELDDGGQAVEAVGDHLNATEEVRADAVHLVDEADTRDVVLVGLAPDGLGLGLDAGDGVKDRDRTVEHAQRALDLYGEVDVARRVDDVDAVTVPVSGRGGRGDGDTALLLLDHPVHGGAPVVDLTDLVVLAGVKKDALGGGRLAGVNVRHDPNIADLVQGDIASGHFELSLITSGSARRPCWTRPSWPRPPDASLQHRHRYSHQ